MSAWPDLVEWFRDDVPPSVVPDPAVVPGGTALLSHFLSIVGGIDRGGGELAIAAPYVSRGVVDQLRGWHDMRHRDLDLLLVAAGSSDALSCREELGGLPWRSAKITVRPGLHAKLFAFVNAAGGGACPVGSHNLTLVASCSNHDAGVMFIGTRAPQIGRVVRACRAHIERLALHGRPHVDTIRWPVGRAA